MEIGFWRDLLRQKGTPENFLAQRQEDWEDFKKNLPELDLFLKELPEDARVLEVGCGLISPLEFSEGKGQITAIDPLVPAYQQLMDLHGRRVRYQHESGEGINAEAESFDAVVCLNVIDHTPNPDLMLAEIKRVLKPGGALFFEVNFDAALSPAHYGLWNSENVHKSLAGFKLLKSRMDERPEYNQSRYWAVYEK